MSATALPQIQSVGLPHEIHADRVVAEMLMARWLSVPAACRGAGAIAEADGSRSQHTAGQRMIGHASPLLRPTLCVSCIEEGHAVMWSQKAEDWHEKA
jgi:hypothetical protein